MAEPSIVQGLFGITPESYQQQRDAAALQRAAAFGQMSPMESARTSVFYGANQLGNVAAGMLGAEDPQMRLISQRNALAKQFDVSTPEGLGQYASALQEVGDTQGALEVSNISRKAASEVALAKQRMFEKQGVDPIQQLIRAGKHYPASIALYEKSGNIKDLELIEKPNKAVAVGNSLVDSVTGLVLYEGPDVQKYSEFAKTLIDAGLKPGTEPFQKRMLEYATKKVEGAGKGTGNVTIGGINVDTGAAAKKASEVIGTNVANIESQFSLKTAFDDAIKIVNQGIYAGAYGPEKQFVAKFTGIGSPQKVENTEVFMANIGEIVIPRLQQFGGNDSNEELKYLQKVVAGDLRMEPKAMLRVLESAERKTRNNIERLQKQVSSAGKNEPLSTAPINAPLGSPQNPIKLKDK
jgi:hypothetical protein